jgi:hypothetical protein
LDEFPRDDGIIADSSNRFSIAPPGLEIFWNTNPQLKLRAIVRSLCEAEARQRKSPAGEPAGLEN